MTRDVDDIVVITLDSLNIDVVTDTGQLSGNRMASVTYVVVVFN